ncbi:MAG: SDR family oxidoreductase [Burkholderiaceae bacterium]
MFTSETLAGRAALITGSGSGIGLEIATLYARLGASVMLVGRDAQRLNDARQRLGVLAERAGACVADVRDYDQVAAAVARTVEQFGSLDILVNNAAGNFHCPTASLSPNGWRTVVDIDLNGTFHGCRASYEALKASRHGGAIISIITMQALSGWPGAAHAAAAKAGVLSLSRTLAVEWGADQIRVNTISPGPIGDTEGVQRMYEQTGRMALEQRRVALGRFGRKEDVANAAAYLASDLARYVTGENLVVDGGRWLTYVAA